MSVQGFKNLMKISLFNDDSFQPLLKKNDEYRKITQLSIDHFQGIAKNYESFEGAYNKILSEYDQEIQHGEIHVPQYYHEYIQLYRNMYSEHKFFCEKLVNNFKQLTALCNNIFTNYSNLILTFQGLIRSYKSHEQILFELSKKYFRTHKTMLGNIQSYKNSFTDVKLIYNMDEKTKRFNACQGTYKNLLEQLETIQEKLKQINEEKIQISESYADIEKQFKIALKTIGSKLIAMAKMFMYDVCLMQKTMITFLAEKKFTLEKIELKTFFNSETKIKQEDFFNVVVDRSKCEILPSFIVYSKNIKEESYQILNRIIIAYVRQIESKILERTVLNKKILEITANFTKIYEKYNYFGLKEIMSNYDKVKKKLSEIFGNRLTSFLKSNNSVFDISVGINEKLLKRTPAKLKLVETSLAQQGKTLEIFVKELKTNVDKFFKKKEIKKIFDGEKEGHEFTEQQPTHADLTGFKLQYTSFTEYLTHLIEGFVEKIKKSQDQIKFQYNAFVNDISVSTNEIYSLCCQYQELYFGENDFISNFKKYQADIDKTLENQSKFFEEINFGHLKQEENINKIVFESQINKVEEYKKIKKPMEIQIEEIQKKQQKKQDQSKKKDNVSQSEVQKADSEKNGMKQSVLGSPQKVENKQKIENVNKYEQFLLSKITLLPDQKFYKSFSCGLSDKIILTGRLFITNKRLCFHSKFNSTTVFFRDTFMQIPKKDIKKIEKRVNAIVFDNSISITTVHGQVFLTSFFSRNEAYDLICSALDINSDEVMFEPEEIKEDPIIEAGPVKEIDDIQNEILEVRKEKIDSMLSNFPYKELYQAQFIFSGLDALKFLKLFEQGCEFSYNRKTFKSWAAYFKDILQHKDYDIGQWTPQIAPFLNSGNIKDTTPECFTKKINCLVPISNSGVPFMPKFAKSEEIVSLYIYSKDKFIIESTIQNSGVPYSDTFNLKLRKVFETSGQEKCRMTSYFYINFVTSTIMKSVIQSKSTEETKASFIKYEEEVNKYLKYLKKLKNKFAKNHSGDEPHQSKQNASNDEYEKEIAEAKQSEDKVKGELKQARSQIQKGKKILLGSLILNVLLILILIS